jgi:hypothetical protein
MADSHPDQGDVVSLLHVTSPTVECLDDGLKECVDIPLCRAADVDQSGVCE